MTPVRSLVILPNTRSLKSDPCVGHGLTHGWVRTDPRMVLRSLLFLLYLLLNSYYVPMNVTAPPRSDDQSEFFRTIIPCEEERRQYTSAPANGFRWFRSKNVIDLELERRRRVAERRD